MGALFFRRFDDVAVTANFQRMGIDVVSVLPAWRGLPPRLASAVNGRELLAYRCIVALHPDRIEIWTENTWYQPGRKLLSAQRTEIRLGTRRWLGTVRLSVGGSKFWLRRADQEALAASW